MRKGYAAAMVLAVLAMLGSACTSQDDVTLLHREITDVQRQVGELQVSTLDKSDLASMEQRLQDITAQTLRSNADLTLRVEKLQEQIEALHASLERTTRSLESISQELAAARTRRVSPPTYQPQGSSPAQPDATGQPPDAAATDQPGDPAPTGGSPEALYRSAYEDYMRANYDLAAEGFRDYLRRWGETDLADNALYWIGECYDAQERSQEALDVFSEVLDKFPSSDKAAAAQLKKGLLYLKLDDQGQGVINLQYVVYEHPGTKEAELAREKLRSLGLTIR